MIEINNTINQIKNNLKDDLPKILSEYGINDFDIYDIGYPTDQAKKICALRFAGSNNNDESEIFTFTVHIQMPGIEENEAYKYIDAIKEYLVSFSPYKLGFQNKSYVIELLENFRAGDFQAFFDVTMTAPKDDCD